MNRFVTVLALAMLALCLVAAGPAGARGWTATPHSVASFSPGDYGSFAEGMAADSHGRLYASLTTWGYADETTAESNIGEIWRVTPGQDPVRVAQADISAYGMLLGVAIDRCDRVYVALFDMGSGMIGNGVYRVDRGRFTQVVSLPEGAWPNGLAFHEGHLYVSDSAGGAVWRVRLGGGVAAPVRPWIQDGLLKPTGQYGIGANGLAFFGDAAYVSVSDRGRIVRVPVRSDGTAGACRTVAQAAGLQTADGIAFDARGGLWITVNGGSTGASPSGALYRLGPGGGLSTIADDPGWLDYPTQPVFGTTTATTGTLYLENGAYDSAYGDGTSPSIEALNVGIPGLPLW